VSKQKETDTNQPSDSHLQCCHKYPDSLKLFNPSFNDHIKTAEQRIIIQRGDWYTGR